MGSAYSTAPADWVRLIKSSLRLSFKVIKRCFLLNLSTRSTTFSCRDLGSDPWGLMWLNDALEHYFFKTFILLSAPFQLISSLPKPRSVKKQTATMSYPPPLPLPPPPLPHIILNIHHHLLSSPCIYLFALPRPPQAHFLPGRCLIKKWNAAQLMTLINSLHRFVRNYTNNLCHWIPTPEGPHCIARETKRKTSK